VIARPCEAVARVLPPAPIDERPCPPSEPRALQAIEPAAMLEDASRIDGDGLDAGSPFRDRVCVG
jgi:hypothetical protein